MISREVRLLMKHKVNEGVPIARVARELGVARQTVYNALFKVEPKERSRRGSKLDPFKDHVRARLELFDIPATVLFREVREQGYNGSLTTLKVFVREVKGEQVRRLTERFETLPGQQAQVDWGECGIVEVNGVRRRLYVFVLVLGYSRMLFARFTTSTRQPLLLSLLRESFERLGAPKELLVDNMRQAVDRHALGEEVRFNRAFLDFCEHYGVLPLASPPYWPRVKGKVESGVKYIKRSFLAGRTFATVEELNQQLEAWLDSVANVRDHGTTGERPVDRYQREAQVLRPAAAVPRYDTRELLLRKVASDAHVRLFGVAYSVPPAAVGQTVQVRLAQNRTGEAFEIIHGGRVLARHRIARRGERRVTQGEHERQLQQLNRRRRNLRPKQRYQQLPAGDEPQFPPAPVVQTRSLLEYERLLESA